MTRFLIDENLPRWFSLWSGPEFVFVHDIGPSWSDTENWNYALAHNLTIVSRDADYAHRAMLATTYPPVVHIRLRNMRMRAWHGVMSARWPEIIAALDDHRVVAVYADRLQLMRR